MEIESIPVNVADEAWFLATTVCRESKIDADQWHKIFPKIYGVLIQRWRHECQKVTDIEEREWKDRIWREYHALALEKCEPAWQRFLYYKRCKHLRYLAILISGAAVLYLCPLQTIYLPVADSERLWAIWYFAFTFITLVGVPLALALTIGSKKLSNQQNVQRVIAGILTLGLVVPVGLLFATLFWQLTGNVHEWSSWLMSILAIPFCIGGSVAVMAEVFQWIVKRPPHPLEVYLFEKLEGDSTNDIGENIDQQLTQFALKVCRSSPMDDDSFQQNTAEDIKNSLYILWEDNVRDGADPEEALTATFKEFGPMENAVYKDFFLIRILFYHRHKATRYLAIIGSGLFVVYSLLVANTGADLNERGLWLEPYTKSFYFIQVNRTNGSWLWTLWGDNVLNGSLLALCIFLKARLSGKFWPFNHLFAFGCLWWLGKILFDAIIVFGSILVRWNGLPLLLALVTFEVIVCPTLSVLIVCTVGEYFAPFSSNFVAKTRRWIGAVGKLLQTLLEAISKKQPRRENNL